MSNENERASQRRGFLKTLGLGTAAAAAAATPALAANPRADAVPSRDSRKENAQTRLAARYKADSPHVQAFYRTNRPEH